jgi:hypothetical protein
VAPFHQPTIDPFHNPALALHHKTHLAFLSLHNDNMQIASKAQGFDDPVDQLAHIARIVPNNLQLA